MFENVDGRTDDGRRSTGILIAHLGAFGSGELKISLALQPEALDILLFSKRLAS